MRLGSYPADLGRGTQVARLYGAHKVTERHRHRYEVNNAYRQELEKAGLVISGVSPDSTLVEFVELPAEVHPFFVATQAHPELKSRPTKPHPLFVGLIEAALRRKHPTGCRRTSRDVARHPDHGSRPGRRGDVVAERPHGDDRGQDQ